MPELVAGSGADRGVLRRAIGVIVSPGETFAEVARNPRPAGVLFLACLVIAVATGAPQLTERGRVAILDLQVQQIERFTGQPVNDEMYAQLENQSRYGAYLTAGQTFVMMPVVSIVVAGILWVVFSAVLGGAAPFKSVLAVVTHSQIIAALGAVAAVPIQYVQGIQSMAGPFNLGALAPMLDPQGFLAMFLGAISVFAIWQLIVVAIGLGALYRRRTSGIAIGLVAAFVMLVATVTSIVSSFIR